MHHNQALIAIVLASVVAIAMIIAIAKWLVTPSVSSTLDSVGEKDNIDQVVITKPVRPITTVNKKEEQRSARPKPYVTT